MKVHKSFNFSGPSVKPANLWDGEPIPSRAVVYSWGYDASNMTVKILGKKTLDIIPESSCRKEITDFNINYGICASPSMMCGADKGSGLYIRDTNNKSILIGLASYPVRCGYTNPQKMANYIKLVGSLQNWIAITIATN